MGVPLHGPFRLLGQLEADLVVSQEAVLSSEGALQCHGEVRSSKTNSQSVIQPSSPDLLSLYYSHSERRKRLKYFVLLWVLWWGYTGRL